MQNDGKKYYEIWDRDGCHIGLRAESRIEALETEFPAPCILSADPLPYATIYLISENGRQFFISVRGPE
jgi:hypothetical protein